MQCATEKSLDGSTIGYTPTTNTIHFGYYITGMFKICCELLVSIEQRKYLRTARWNSNKMIFIVNTIIDLNSNFKIKMTSTTCKDMQQFVSMTVSDGSAGGQNCPEAIRNLVASCS